MCTRLEELLLLSSARSKDDLEDDMKKIDHPTQGTGKEDKNPWNEEDINHLRKRSNRL